MSTATTVRFTEIGIDAGLGDVLNHSGSPEQRFIVETLSAGASWLDADVDGWLDLFLTDGSHLETSPEGAGNRLLLNEAHVDGGRWFRDITKAAGVGHSGWAMGSAVGDVDADGDPDLYVTYWGEDRFYRNDGGIATPLFVHLSDSGLANNGWGTSATFADFDNDGRL
ncbi:MAG: VCBS repeat-containing protein, partial [Candidatus Latescibacterota bacterium]